MDAIKIYEKQIKPKLALYEHCHIFTGSTTSNGYGRVRTVAGVLRTHRVAYEALKAPIPQGMEVMHLCNTKLCCNPEHLKLGTHAENMGYWAATGGGIKKPGISGIVGGFPAEQKGILYWIAVGSKNEYLYHGKDFFEACCVRKSWEIGKNPAGITPE